MTAYLKLLNFGIIILLMALILIGCSSRRWNKYIKDEPAFIPDEVSYYKDYIDDTQDFSPYQEDVYEYVYESKIEGFIEYKLSDGIHKGNALSVTLEHSVTYGQEKLMLYIDFEGVDFTLVLWLIYDEELNKWYLSNYEDKPTYFFANLNSEYDEFYTMPDSEFNLTIDNYDNGVIKNIKLRTAPDKDFNGWSGYEEHIRYLDTEINLRLTGYIAEGDYKSNLNVNKIRYKNTYHKIQNIPDEITEKVFSEPKKHLGELVKHLTEDVYDVFEEVKIIGEWIAENIYYDLPAVVEKRFVNPTPEVTLTNRKSDGSGFAYLFSEMCYLAGIDVATIFGKTKGYLYRTSGEIDYHTWNAIRVNEQWFIIDVALNCGNYVDYDGSLIKKPYTTKYLLLEPKYAIHTHFPDKKLHQFLRRAVSEDRFFELPKRLNVTHLTSTSFESGIEFKSKVQNLMQVEGEPFAVKIDTPNTIRKVGLSLTDRKGRNVRHCSLTEKGANGFILRFGVPQGEYNAGIWALKGKDWFYVGDVAIQNKLDPNYSTIPNVEVLAPFPFVTNEFYDYNIDFLSSNIGKIRLTKGVYRVDVESDVPIMAKLIEMSNEKEYEQSVLTHHKRNVYTFYVSPPMKGEYRLELFALDNDNEVYIANTSLIASSDSSDYVKFPQQNDEHLQTVDFYLYSPMCGELESGKVYGFVIYLPDAEQVFILTNGENSKEIQHHLDKNRGGIFADEYRVKAGNKLDIMIKLNSKDKPKKLLSYTIE